jgi:hypothetical protein
MYVVASLARKATLTLKKRKLISLWLAIFMGQNGFLIQRESQLKGDKHVVTVLLGTARTVVFMLLLREPA